ncbi:MAG: dihydroxyacetone kinase phosphoryl donor subunit DhaM [Streptosporangiaceae bacterium]|jgi:PTS hybrid protein
MTAMVGIVLVSHSAPLADGTAELAGQVGGDSVTIATAGGTDDGRIGTSISKLQRALRLADAGAGVVILPDLGSSVLTVRALLAEPDDLPGQVVMADAPFVEGAVAAAVAAAGGGDLAAVLDAAQEARHARKL